MCLAIGIDVHSKKLTSFAVPQDEENIDESEFCLEFNKEFKSTPRLLHQDVDDIPEGPGAGLLEQPCQIGLNHVVRCRMDVEERDPQEPRRDV